MLLDKEASNSKLTLPNNTTFPEEKQELILQSWDNQNFLRSQKLLGHHSNYFLLTKIKCKG